MIKELRSNFNKEMDRNQMEAKPDLELNSHDKSSLTNCI